MTRFLQKAIGFLAMSVVFYLVLTTIYSQIPALEKRWNQGIPNWISESSFSLKMDDFESFCASTKGKNVNLILGSSTALHGINPEILGDNWYSLASRGQNPFVTDIVLKIAESTCEEHLIDIDTVLIDIYPEFCQEWVFNKADALEHLALTAQLSDILPHATSVFQDGGIRRIHSAISFRLNNTDNSNRVTATNARGYEEVANAGHNEQFKVPWKEDAHQFCLQSIAELDSKNETTIFVNPPVLHQNHLNDLRNQLKSSISSPWVDANTNRQFTDSTLFFDDHHLNDDGATLYTHWIKSNFALH